MENKNARVFAYERAKVIEMDDLSEVSGGFNMSHQQTLRSSGAGPIHNMDASVDLVVDW